MVEQI
jgi:aldehyde dehydrogenase (NAD+)